MGLIVGEDSWDSASKTRHQALAPTACAASGGTHVRTLKELITVCFRVCCLPLFPCGFFLNRCGSFVFLLRILSSTLLRNRSLLFTCRPDCFTPRWVFFPCVFSAAFFCFARLPVSFQEICFVLTSDKTKENRGVPTPWPVPPFVLLMICVVSRTHWVEVSFVPRCGVFDFPDRFPLFWSQDFFCFNLGLNRSNGEVSFVLLMIFYCFPGCTERICIACVVDKMAASVECLDRFCFFCGFSQRYLDGKVLDNGSAIRKEVPGPTVSTEERGKVPLCTENTGNFKSQATPWRMFALYGRDEVVSRHRKGRFVKNFWSVLFRLLCI